jgi:alkanesulfonate monooxygenase SsuD/methylene tetrahydromethanopterin reductase-like flavin-dependent oxidoreductase (luciferase family)
VIASLIKFSLGIPLGVIEPAGEFQSQEAAAHMGRTLESAGVAACYVTDHPAPVATWLHAHGHDATDPFTSLAFVAAATRSLRLHTNVVVLPYRNPFITAKAAAILQVFSGGRLILGVGAGYQQGEFAALGVDFTKRDVLTDEALETIRLAWSGGPVVNRAATSTPQATSLAPFRSRPLLYGSVEVATGRFNVPPSGAMAGHRSSRRRR